MNDYKDENQTTKKYAPMDEYYLFNEAEKEPAEEKVKAKEESQVEEDLLHIVAPWDKLKDGVRGENLTKGLY